MKNNRRRRHLRPRLTRSQINHQIQKVTTTMHLFRLEWLLEAEQAEPDHQRLYFLHDAIVAMRDEIADLEEL